MKFLKNWGIRLGLCGGAMLGVFFGMTPESLALPQAQIIEKLQQVPVFTVANENGSPLVSQGENDSRVAGVFISQQDAREFVGRLKKENPELGAQVQVVALSLGRVYQLDQESESQGNGLDFAYVPMQEEVESAVSVLKRQGQQVQQFSGVPLFFARVGGSNQGMLTLEKNGEQFVPLFFEKEQLQQRVDQFKQAQPEEAESIEIGVTSLENVLATLQETNDEQYRQLVLYPSQESLQFLESVANNMSEPQ